ncbi:HNH endonuclease [Streptomyces luteoverticillatus]|uniref:HNH endonuclease n=2 Tax=Streptomyces TaxID=1883 RepID=A0A3Q9G1V1_STRLT|nr:HNH endonuclease [Streptomyces luteoverticillatus]
MSRVRYSRDLLQRTAAVSSSLVDMMRRLDTPLSSGPRRYLRDRLAHYGVETSHFVDEPLPERERRSYPREVLEEAAAHSHCVRQMLEYMGVPPYDSSYSHIWRKLEAFGIDTSHFQGRRGNGQRPLIPRSDLEAAVAKSYSLAGVLRALGRPNGGSARILVKRSIAAHGVSTDHFVGQGHQLGRASRNRKAATEILRRLEAGSPRTRTILLRRALDESGVAHTCQECGIGDTWRGKRLVLEIDHINGDRLDNRIKNLRYLCPSCHSQTSTFSTRSIRLSISSQPRNGTQYSRRDGPVPQLAKRAPV